MKKFVFISLVSLFLFACEKETDKDDTHHVVQGNRTINVWVSHIYQTSPVLDSAVAGQEVKIYDNRIDFIENEVNYEAVRTTDSTGLAVFQFRSADYYYIRAEHDELGEVTDSVSTPSGTTSFVELYFY